MNGWMQCMVHLLQLLGVSRTCGATANQYVVGGRGGGRVHDGYMQWMYAMEGAHQCTVNAMDVCTWMHAMDGCTSMHMDAHGCMQWMDAHGCTWMHAMDGCTWMHINAHGCMQWINAHQCTWMYAMEGAHQCTSMHMMDTCNGRCTSMHTRQHTSSITLLITQSIEDISCIQGQTLAAKGHTHKQHMSCKLTDELQRWHMTIGTQISKLRLEPKSCNDHGQTKYETQNWLWVGGLCILIWGCGLPLLILEIGFSFWVGGVGLHFCMPDATE